MKKDKKQKQQPETETATPEERSIERVKEQLAEREKDNQ